MTDLKLCAHCGGEARLYNNHNATHDVECMKCGLSTHNYKTPEEACDDWDLRDEGWIPVVDRYPPDNNQVDVWQSGLALERRIPDLWRSNDRWYPIMPNHESKLITHWKPKPKGPNS